MNSSSVSLSVHLGGKGRSQDQLFQAVARLTVARVPSAEVSVMKTLSLGCPPRLPTPAPAYPAPPQDAWTSPPTSSERVNNLCDGLF